MDVVSAGRFFATLLDAGAFFVAGFDALVPPAAGFVVGCFMPLIAFAMHS